VREGRIHAIASSTNVLYEGKTRVLCPFSFLLFLNFSNHLHLALIKDEKVKSIMIEIFVQKFI